MFCRSWCAPHGFMLIAKVAVGSINDLPLFWDPEALERLARRRTTLLVTHDLRLAARCSTIVVLDRGRIVERGSHDYLLARGGRYATLYLRQTAPDRIGRDHAFLS